MTQPFRVHLPISDRKVALALLASIPLDTMQEIANCNQRLAAVRENPNATKKELLAVCSLAFKVADDYLHKHPAEADALLFEARRLRRFAALMR